MLITGGGANAPFVRQLQADVYGPRSSRWTARGPRLGAALLAAVGVKAFADVAAACRATLKRLTPESSDLTVHESYASPYQRFKDALPGAEGLELDRRRMIAGPRNPFHDWPIQIETPTFYAWYTEPGVFVSQITVERATAKDAEAVTRLIDHVLLAKRRARRHWWATRHPRLARAAIVRAGGARDFHAAGTDAQAEANFARRRSPSM